MTPQAAAETNALIAELWQRHLPTLKERLDTLDRIAAAATTAPLSEADRQQAVSIAHKFAGSLGMYGYQRGTEIAMQLEALYRTPPVSQPQLLAPLTRDLRLSIFPNS
jgi:HPt (histidine-containing phosphotransfer) domain-containing protein